MHRLEVKAFSVKGNDIVFFGFFQQQKSIIIFKAPCPSCISCDRLNLLRFQHLYLEECSHQRGFWIKDVSREALVNYKWLVKQSDHRGPADIQRE